MTELAPSAHADEETGEISFVGPEVLRELLYAAEEDNLLSVVLDAPGPAERGKLGLLISDAIETALELRGACAPGIGVSSDLGTAVRDQLYRARLVELRGLLLAIPPLAGVLNLGGSLDAEDSAVLRWWLAATREHPVRLYIDASNRFVGVYERPSPLIELLDGQRRSRSAPPPALLPSLSESAAAMELSELPPAVVAASASLSSPRLAAEVDEVDSADAADERGAPELTSEPQASASIATEFEPPTSESASVATEFEPPAPATSEDAHGAASADTHGTPRAAGPVVREIELPELPDEPAAFPREPLYPNAAEQWPGWLAELEAARGPKPLAAVERMFVTNYVPLADAVARGIAGSEAQRALNTWSQSFEQSYREAFDALRVRGKRPTMVLDVPDIALRIGRLHGARSVQLVVVDAMRFDLGLRVEQRLRHALGQGAALTERLLLWSALPATTAVQLELLGRGPSALAEFTGIVESEVPVARGRMASTLRRVKSGHRELLKLDIVESAISEPGGLPAERLDTIADDTARALASYMKRQAARTLVMVFGDHGFALDTLEGGLTRARHGGASPEEALVPAFAWLVGGVH